jgi:hypothetical protein
MASKARFAARVAFPAHLSQAVPPIRVAHGDRQQQFDPLPQPVFDLPRLACSFRLG